VPNQYISFFLLSPECRGGGGGKTGALTFRKQNKSHLKARTRTRAHNTLWGHLSLEVLHRSPGQTTTGYTSIGSVGHVQIVIVIGAVILFYFFSSSLSRRHCYHHPPLA